MPPSPRPGRSGARRGPALALALFLAGPPPVAAAGGGAIARVAEEIAAQLAEGAPADRVGLTVAAPGAEALAEPFAAALAAALSRRGLAPLPMRGREVSEAAARALGADRLVRARVSLSASGVELAASAESYRLHENFFLQRTPASAPERIAQALVPADALARALGRTASPPRLASPVLVPLFAVPDRILALAVLEGGDSPTLVAATPEGLLLLSTAGQRLAFRPAPPPAPGRALREQGAALAVGDFGGGRIAWQPAGAAQAEVVAVEGGRLERVASLPATPLCAGGAGALYGAFAPGLPVFADRLAGAVDGAVAVRPGHTLLAAAAAPRAGRAAFAVLRDDDAALILDSARRETGPAVEGVGAGLALADIDGDGEPELVASSAEAGPADRVRMLRLGPAREMGFQSQPIPGAVRAAAAGDVTGDGVDDAVLAALLPTGGTQLWLLTADPREAR